MHSGAIDDSHHPHDRDCKNIDMRKVRQLPKLRPARLERKKLCSDPTVDVFCAAHDTLAKQFSAGTIELQDRRISTSFHAFETCRCIKSLLNGPMTLFARRNVPHDHIFDSTKPIVKAFVVSILVRRWLCSGKTWMGNLL